MIEAKSLHKLFCLVEKLIKALPGFVVDHLWDVGIMDEYAALKKECKWTPKSKSPKS